MHQNSNNNQEREASRIENNHPQKKNPLHHKCSKKDMSIKFQGVRATKIQP